MKEKKSKQGRQRNALKHGAFATEILIFEEDTQDFKVLHSELIEELKPSGRMEEDVVVAPLPGVCTNEKSISIGIFQMNPESA